MNMRDLIPWGRNSNPAPLSYRDDAGRQEQNPFLQLHREMNRLPAKAGTQLSTSPDAPATPARATQAASPRRKPGSILRSLQLPREQSRPA
jgi:hypothetical protein